MHQTRRIAAALAAAGMIAAVAVPTVAAKSAGNRLPVAVSTASFTGYADAWTGLDPLVDPASAVTLHGVFTKGAEYANGTYETTMVNFTLPDGVVVDPADVVISNNTCRELAEQVVTVTDNVVHFALGCDYNPVGPVGETFTWDVADAEGASGSFIAVDGNYPVNVELKISWMNRSKIQTNMWQARTVGTFDVPQAAE